MGGLSGHHGRTNLRHQGEVQTLSAEVAAMRASNARLLEITGMIEARIEELRLGLAEGVSLPVR